LKVIKAIIIINPRVNMVLPSATIRYGTPPLVCDK